jgi:hypothetical protein
MKVKNLESNYQENQYFKHIDGGYYMFEKAVLFADDNDELVIYKHMYPFEVSSWARRYSEFKQKFTPISREEFETAQEIDRSVLQQRIAENKKLRRSKV